MLGTGGRRGAGGGTCGSHSPERTLTPSPIPPLTLPLPSWSLEQEGLPQLRETKASSLLGDSITLSSH